MFSFCPVGENVFEQVIKPRPVIEMEHVAQLVNDDVLNTRSGCFYEFQIQGYSAFAAETAPARFHLAHFERRLGRAFLGKVLPAFVEHLGEMDRRLAPIPRFKQHRYMRWIVVNCLYVEEAAL